MKQIPCLMLAAGLALGAGAAHAQSVTDCDWRARADAIPEPWEAHTRTFANGDVRLAVLDVLEPAGGPVYLMIISPPRDELGSRMCKIVGLDGSIGFADLDFGQLGADYDPSMGLLFDMPVRAYNPDTTAFEPGTLHVQLNQATGTVQAQIGPPM